MKVTADENGLKEIKNDINSDQETAANISIKYRIPSANLPAHDRTLKCIPPLTIIKFPQKVFINHVHAIDMIKIHYFIIVLFIGTLTSFLTYSISGLLSASPLIMEESNAQPEGGSLNLESQDRES
ncbi:MAG: hypothetical protein WAU25_03455, partial [Nitrososphaeraceae archaeon]